MVTRAPNATPEERVSRLEERLGTTFSDRALAVTALTHKSYSNEHKLDACPDNERLEFLGDAVVDLAVGHRLMERFPEADEGELSKLRASIVNEDGLARVARAMGLGELLRLGRGEELTGGREKESLLADTFEAVVGALYLSNGMGGVMAFVDRIFAGPFQDAAEGRQGQDFKSLLQEKAQGQLHAAPKYRVVAESGPEHEKRFEVEVTVGDAVLARSTGRSKKEAEQAAAREALERMLAQPPGQP